MTRDKYKSGKCFSAASQLSSDAPKKMCCASPQVFFFIISNSSLPTLPFTSLAIHLNRNVPVPQHDTHPTIALLNPPTTSPNPTINPPHQPPHPFTLLRHPIRIQYILLNAQLPATNASSINNNDDPAPQRPHQPTPNHTPHIPHLLLLPPPRRHKSSPSPPPRRPFLATPCIRQPLPAEQRAATRKNPWMLFREGCGETGGGDVGCEGRSGMLHTSRPSLPGLNFV